MLHYYDSFLFLHDSNFYNEMYNFFYNKQSTYYWLRVSFIFHYAVCPMGFTWGSDNEDVKYLLYVIEKVHFLNIEIYVCMRYFNRDFWGCGDKIAIILLQKFYLCNR